MRRKITFLMNNPWRRETKVTPHHYPNSKLESLMAQAGRTSWGSLYPSSFSTQTTPVAQLMFPKRVVLRKDLWPEGTLEDGLSPGTPWHPWGVPHLPDLESGVSTGTPWHTGGDLHFSPEPQSSPTRLVPMTGPRFQPPGPCPRHELRT